MLDFHVTNTENQWPNQLKATEHFQKVIFPYLHQIKENMTYPKEQILMVIMDTFKGQKNNNLGVLWAKKGCEIVIIPHNLTNKFQTLDISLNSVTKAYFSENYNTSIANEISKQLKKKHSINWCKGFSSPFGDRTLACQMDCRFASSFESWQGNGS